MPSAATTVMASTSCMLPTTREELLEELAAHSIYSYCTEGDSNIIQCKYSGYCNFQVLYNYELLEYGCTGVHLCCPELYVGKKVYFLKEFLENLRWVNRMRGYMRIAEHIVGGTVFVRCYQCPWSLQLQKEGRNWSVVRTPGLHRCQRADPALSLSSYLAAEGSSRCLSYLQSNLSQLLVSYMAKSGYLLRLGGASTYVCMYQERAGVPCQRRYVLGADLQATAVGEHSCRVAFVQRFGEREPRKRVLLSATEPGELVEEKKEPPRKVVHLVPEEEPGACPFAALKERDPLGLFKEVAEGCYAFHCSRTWRHMEDPLLAFALTKSASYSVLSIYCIQVHPSPRYWNFAVFVGKKLNYGLLLRYVADMVEGIHESIGIVHTEELREDFKEAAGKYLPVDSFYQHNFNSLNSKYLLESRQELSAKCLAHYRRIFCDCRCFIGILQNKTIKLFDKELSQGVAYIGHKVLGECGL